MEDVKNQNNGLIVKASIKRRPHFKAGAELSKVVGIVVNDNSNDDMDSFDITFELSNATQVESQAASSNAQAEK